MPVFSWNFWISAANPRECQIASRTVTVVPASFDGPGITGAALGSGAGRGGR